jgi:ribA/ribD-fused uncharacterized protein
MIFSANKQSVVQVSRSNPLDPLAAYSKHGFDLDDDHWPSVEHYYQAMKFEDPDLRAQIRDAPNPDAAVKLAKKNKRRIRADWKNVRVTMMTRGVYIKCRSHPEVARALMDTGARNILETSQYDYYWGCGRDGRGENAYGQVLMNVRERLHQE